MPAFRLAALLPTVLIACGLLFSLTVRLHEGTAVLPGVHDAGERLAEARVLLGSFGDPWQGPHGDQDACHSLPEEEEPIRRFPASSLRNKSLGGKSRWPGASRGDWPIASFASPSSRTLSAAAFRAAPPAASRPFAGRYPVFLFADLPPPSAA